MKWADNGFIPWGTSIGGADHYKSCKAYQCVSASAFRSQAKKIARIALEQITNDEIKRNEAIKGGLVLSPEELERYTVNEKDDAKKKESQIEEKIGNDTRVNEKKRKDDAKKKESQIEEKSDTVVNPIGPESDLPIDSFNRNPWVRFQPRVNARPDNNFQDDDESEDENYTASDEDDNSSDDDLSPEDYQAIKLGELQNSHEPFLTEYPSGDKLLAIFPLDGNVADMDANRFEFIQDNTLIRRWGKIPKERENCVALIGLGAEKPSRLGFSDPDLMVVDAEIKKRLKANNYKRDKNGDIWEIRATLQLPFKCEPQFYSRNGKSIKSFRMRSNGRGFSWGFFWLLAWKPEKAKPKKLIGGKLVTTILEDESSTYTEKTYKSKFASK